MEDNGQMTNVDVEITEDGLLHEVEHYQQKYNWDCGISCVLMVLPAQSRRYLINNFYKVIEEEKFGQSTWTIDLCYLLHRFNMKFSYFTTTIGVDPGYSNQNFYDKVLSKDSDRVNNKFSRAATLNMHVEKKSVLVNEVLDRLEKGPVIVLINANQLFCSTCSESSYSCYTSCLSLLQFCEPERISWTMQIIIDKLSKLLCSDKSYQGHYITLVGHQRNKSEILYRNPTFKNKICRMPLDWFEDCRTAYGTDEDIIFVNGMLNTSTTS